MSKKIPYRETEYNIIKNVVAIEEVEHPNGDLSPCYNPYAVFRLFEVFGFFFKFL